MEEIKSIVAIKARQCGFSATMNAKMEAEIKAGKKVYFGKDFAHGKDKTVVTVKLPDNPFSLTPNYLYYDHLENFHGAEINPFVTLEEAREMNAYFTRLANKAGLIHLEMMSKKKNEPI